MIAHDHGAVVVDLDVAQHAEVGSSVSIGSSGSDDRDAATARARSSVRVDGVGVAVTTAPARVGAGDHLHLGEQPAQRLGVPPSPAGAAATTGRRPRGGRSTPLTREHLVQHARRPRPRRSAGSTPTPGRGDGRSTGWVADSSARSGQTRASAASSRRRDSSVPRARVTNQRPA